MPKDPFWDVLRKYKVRDFIPDHVFHYTSLPALVGIVTSSRIWCSDIRFSNDPAEVTYGREVIHEIIADNLDEQELVILRQWMQRAQYYAASFSAAPDSLPQWRAYCNNGRGVAIGFDTLQLLYNGRLELYPVEYDRSRQDALVRDVVQVYRDLGGRAGDADIVANTRNLARTLIRLAGIFKDNAYEAEREFRLFTTRFRDAPGASPTVAYRASQSTIVPYLQMPLGNGPVLPVVRVILGPCLEQDLTLGSVTEFLRASGYDIPVTRSAVRMRAT